MVDRKKRSIIMVQVNYQYGNNVFIPYAVGAIQAYAETIPEIKNNFQFQKPIFLRKDTKEVVDSIEKPDIIGFSCYIWNWEYNKKLAKEIKERFPNCLVVFGGTNVPNKSEDFFVKHSFVDILVHQEGEVSFAKILLESTNHNPDYSKIEGLSVRTKGTGTLKTKPSARISDLSVLPSPYISGTFDFLLKSPYILNASQETTRGCPYSCTYCDWGSESYKKIVCMTEERVLSEFEWFGKNKVEYIFNCDANYGISKRDYDLTLKMIEAHHRNDGYPSKFRMCTAKNSDDRIFDITKLLSDSSMNKGATLSFQSMDAVTLKAINRDNIKMEKFSELMDRYHNAGIATYTELIMGLPGETYESSKKGIDILFKEQASTVNLYVYPCTLLPNSKMNDTDYLKFNGIRYVRMPLLLSHSTPEIYEITEHQNVIVETNAMPCQDWQKTYLFYWAVQCLHCLGLLSNIAIVFNKKFDVKYSVFYEKFIEYFTLHDKKKTLIGREIASVMGIVLESVNGGRLDLVNHEFGEIRWPLEEASFLNFVTNKEEFFEDVASFIVELAQSLSHDVDSDLLDDIIVYQSSLVKDPFVSDLCIQLRYNLFDYFSSLRCGGIELKKSSSKLKIKGDRDFCGNVEEYAREVVWYGRKGGKSHHANVVKL